MFMLMRIPMMCVVRSIVGVAVLWIAAEYADMDMRVFRTAKQQAGLGRCQVW
ncbi:Uncharacterised protein [Klebsiella pneumoniae]|uniref:Uncharacterized protein n=1 Tax=Klebsiella pneumoniae TaxID=573 RepID=A0A447RQV2_KLEPN|nr:Uncharacterised protein [Klebsiella pneumoniae]